MVVKHFPCRKICEIVCGFPGSELNPSSSACGHKDNILMETRKFSDNTSVTEKRLVSGVDRVLRWSNSTF